MATKEKSINSVENIHIGSKSTRGRKAGAIAFPRNSLTDALRVAKSIWNDNAGHPFPLGDIASKLNYSPTSSSFRDIIRSAERYGLTEGTWVQDTTKTITLSSIGMSIVAPKVGEDPNAYMRQALEIPEVFKGFLNSINGRVIPSEDVCKSTLIRDSHILKEDSDACYAILNKNIQELKLSQPNTQGTPYLRLDKLSVIQLTSSKIQEEEEPMNSDIEEVSAQPTTVVPEIVTKQIPKQIFVAHGKNTKPLEQLKGILDEFKVPYKVAIDEANAGRPVSKKVSDLMRECSSAIFIFTKDEETKTLDGHTVYRPSDNVVFELGAASVLYENKIVIFKENGVSFGSDFKDLGYISFDTDQLGAKTVELMKELIGFGLLKISAT